MMALAAGLGAAMAGGPDEANAQATEIMIPLESGEEIVMNVAHVQQETQEAIFDHLRDCIAGGEKSRSECVGEAATEIARANLDGTVVSAQTTLAPMEATIGLTPNELIQEPVFCDYAEDDASLQACSVATEAVQLAALDLQIAEVRERRIAAETRVAAKEEHLVSVETRVGEKEVVLETSQAANTERRIKKAEQAETIGAQAAVLAALQRVAAKEARTN